MSFAKPTFETSTFDTNSSLTYISIGPPALFVLIVLLACLIRYCQRSTRPVDVVRPHVPYPTAQAGAAPPYSQYPQGNQYLPNQCPAGSPTYPQAPNQYHQGIGTPPNVAPSAPPIASITSQMVGFNDPPPPYDSIHPY